MMFLYSSGTVSAQPDTHQGRQGACLHVITDTASPQRVLYDNTGTENFGVKKTVIFCVDAYLYWHRWVLRELER